jgi:ribosome-binding protein aMBF1 (putative translation factor)
MDVIPGMRGVPLNEAQRALIVKRRTDLGLTQQELGQKIGRKAITIHTIETGKFLPSPKVLEELCKVLSLDCTIVVEVHLSNDGTTTVSRSSTAIQQRKPKKTKSRRG